MHAADARTRLRQMSATCLLLTHTRTRAQAPVVLRLAYHDAATFSAAAGDGGPNASIQFELERPENTGLKRGWKLIEQVRLLFHMLLRGASAAGCASALQWTHEV
eukprot:GHRQ01015848.1.p4 GENE.GHRQ01015848.1~~GHRQ01015848.1.p4  ORF type:complete len:105 (-),score=29.22 GHRQ01015848.1:699-1013(-)